MATTSATKAPGRVIKDPPMPSTLGKQRIRKAIQEVMRDRLSTANLLSSNGKTAARPSRPARSTPRKKNHARFASATATSKKR